MFCYYFNDRFKKIGFKYGWNLLHYHCNSLKSHSSINIFLRQRSIVTLLIFVKFHKHIVPHLYIPIIGTQVSIIWSPCRSSIHINFSRWSTRSNFSSRPPKIIICPQRLNSLSRHTYLLPILLRFFIFGYSFFSFKNSCSNFI